jgi:hypothetical protein
MARAALLAIAALALAAGARAQLLALAADPLYAPIVQVVSAAARMRRPLPVRAPVAALAQTLRRLAAAASPRLRRPPPLLRRLRAQATTKGLVCISDPAVVNGSFDPTQCAGLISLLEEIEAGTPPTGACGPGCQPIFDVLGQPCRDALVGGLSAADNANGAAFSSFFAACEAAATGAGTGAQVAAPAAAPVAAAVEEAAAPAAAVVVEAVSGAERAAAGAAAALLAAALL